MAQHFEARPARRFARGSSTAASLAALDDVRPHVSRPWTEGEDVRLSILMPAYNEQATIGRAIEAVLRTPFPCEIELIVVDDGSQDATPQILARIDDPRARVHRHVRNMGKGAALLTAAALASGTHIVPFDADLEYDPVDVVRMVQPILDERCDVVYGTRLFGANTVYQSYTHAMGNRALTLVANLMFDSYVSDLHTCLKMIPLAMFHELDLRESGFGLDTEITAKILKMGVRPFEVPVSYHSRTSAMGKKITWLDGIECLQVLSRVRFARTRLAPARPIDRAPVMMPLPFPEELHSRDVLGSEEHLVVANRASG